MKTKLLIALGLSFALHAHADSGTWLANPADNNWNNPANWSSGTVPSAFDTATFLTSATTSISIHDYSAIDEIYFSPGADSYTFTLQLPNYFSFYLTGIVNVSGVTENFILNAATADNGNAGVIIFDYGTTAGSTTSFTCEASTTSAGGQGSIQFEQSSAGAATFHDLGATVTGGVGGRTDFYYTGCSAENSTIINDGATADGATGGGTSFSQSKPSAENATLIANGGTNGGGGGSFVFADSSLAANSTLIANGGVSGGTGGTIQLFAASDGGTARVEVFGNGSLDIRQHNALPAVTIGSLEGDGLVFLGQRSLTIGGNSLSTTFSGVIQDNGPTSAASITKIGVGTLILAGANTYHGGTTVAGGVLLVTTKTASGTGTGDVQVNSGTLGGNGLISGAVTIGSESGSGLLAPGVHGTGTLTIEGALAFGSSAIFDYELSAARAKADKVSAAGVTIDRNALFFFIARGSGTLPIGKVFTVIRNTSLEPIAGTFLNLPDGSIFGVDGNNFQASYQGGDGNDLTLTVVP